MNTAIPDYTLAAQELDALFKSLHFSADIHGLGLREKDGWKHNAWVISLHRGGDGNGPRMHVADITWKSGTGIKGKPNPAQVLARVCQECLETSECSFDEWCLNNGYDTDSRKAFAIYEQCRENGLPIAKAITNEQMRQFSDLSDRL